MSDKVTVKVKGIDEALKNLKRYQVVKREACSIALKRGAYQIETLAKQTAARKFENPTGRLMGSISVNWAGSSMDRGKVDAPAKSEDGVGKPSGQKELTYVVGSDVKYARRVEHGFVGVDSLGRRYNQQGKPYLFPSYFQYEGEIVKDIGKVFKKDIRLK